MKSDKEFRRKILEMCNTVDIETVFVYDDLNTFENWNRLEGEDNIFNNENFIYIKNGELNHIKKQMKNNQNNNVLKVISLKRMGEYYSKGYYKLDEKYEEYIKKLEKDLGLK